MIRRRPSCLNWPASLCAPPDGWSHSTDAWCPNNPASRAGCWPKDRGKFVRTREEYLRLASARFPKVEPHLRHDLLRIPYTHLIMRCFN